MNVELNSIQMQNVMTRVLEKQILKKYSCRPWRLTPDLIFFSHYEAVKAGGLAGSFVNLYNEPLKLPKLVD